MAVGKWPWSNRASFSWAGFVLAIMRANHQVMSSRLSVRSVSK